MLLLDVLGCFIIGLGCMVLRLIGCVVLMVLFVIVSVLLIEYGLVNSVANLRLFSCYELAD